LSSRENSGDGVGENILYTKSPELIPVWTTVHVVVQLIHRLPQSQLTASFWIYFHPLQTRLLNKQVGVDGHHEGHGHHQGETGADFVVTEKLQFTLPIFKVAVVEELFEEADVSFTFIVSQLCTIQLVETKFQLLFI